ncbi:MAG: hypothetical protein MJE68_33020, partial [Proteobacteria bacterium]|nr:hypothetical protein [Pseudomonadota bacterium]
LSGWTVAPLVGTEAGLDLDFIDVALLFLWRLRLLRREALLDNVVLYMGRHAHFLCARDRVQPPLSLHTLTPTTC